MSSGEQQRMYESHLHLSTRSKTVDQTVEHFPSHNMKDISFYSCSSQLQSNISWAAFNLLIEHSLCQHSDTSKHFLTAWHDLRWIQQETLSTRISQLNSERIRHVRLHIQRVWRKTQSVPENLQPRQQSWDWSQMIVHTPISIASLNLT